MIATTMDRISNRLRLVRSQSMGVGMGGPEGGKLRPGGGGGGGPPAGGRATQVVLLDERRLELTVQPRLYAGELLDLVASQCGLKEKEYFGLAVVDDAGHYTWLQLDRKVLDHDLPRKPAVLTVHFLVKFFIESISHLADNQTVELFYLQARSLIWRGLLEVEADIVFQLAALGLQAAHGDYADDTATRALLKKTTLLPSYVLKEQASHAYCEDQVIEHYRKTAGQTRGQAVVNYMTIVESMPTYGVHYFEVYDKRSTPWWLGLSCKGIAQYKHEDRKVPVRVFQWKQLENLYFRDKKFSIEVHDAKRVVQTLSSFNLYEDALKLDSVSAKDELVDAIADTTTQVSVSRRTFNPGNIHVFVWYAQTSSLTKCIWQSAISQHQFYLDRKQARLRGQAAHRTLKEIARDLTRSSASLSSASSASNLSLSGSSHSLAVSGSLAGSSSQDTELTEEARRARAEMVAALKARKEALEEKLKEKNALLKELCIKEGELTGELPPEIPLAPGEPVPVIRRRVGTEFQISERLINKSGSPEEEQLAGLELELEIQSKITSAALKLANDAGASKGVRRQRKISYNQSQKKLKELEFQVASLRHSLPAGKLGKRPKQPRPAAAGETESGGGGTTARRQGGSVQVLNSLGAAPKLGQPCGPEELRRGVSVPDLGQGGGRMADADDADEVDDEVDEEEEERLANNNNNHKLVSPRSCPSSPRKQPLGLPHHDAVSLNHNLHSPNRSQRGYIPSSVYLRSSYRAKQYPTLSTRTTAGGPIRPVWQPDRDPRSATLPSPYRNKFEVNSGCDSPVGLYNCPQQRTSQAFSSLDDLDGLAASTTGPPTARRPPDAVASAAGPHFPSLERSARKRQQRGHHLVASCSVLPEPRPESRSMEDLEVLENAGARGAAATAARARQQLAVHEQALDDLVYRAQKTTLRNTEEYPAVAARSSYDEVDGGSYPALPLPARRTTLLPGQTYPEPAAMAPPPLPGLGHAHTAALREVFSPHRHTALPLTQTVHARKVETTFGMNDTVHSHSVISPHHHHHQAADAGGGSGGKSDGDEPKPPLYPKQYYHSVKQRQQQAGGSSPWSSQEANHESPAVPRKLKPPIPLPPSSPSSSSLVGPQSPQSLNESSTSIETVVSTAAEGPAGHQGSFVPYRETSKPFEMSDFYKYSTKFRKAGSSVKSSTESDSSPHLADSDSPRSGSASQRSSTSRESVPPELPAKPSPGGGGGITTVQAVPAMARVPHEPGAGGGSKESLADAFSNEMLAWYEQKQKPSGQQHGQPGKPATLV